MHLVRGCVHLAKDNARFIAKSNSVTTRMYPFISFVKKDPINVLLCIYYNSTLNQLCIHIETVL